MKKLGEAPKCPKCGYTLKPAFVYFGEPLSQKELVEAFTLAKTCRVMVVVGTSLAVYPAALIPWEAHQNGAEYS